MLIKNNYFISNAIVTVLSLSLISTMLSACSDKSHTHDTTSLFAKDSASSDTPVETLKTLTADISAVEQQNQQIVTQNKALIEQDKSTLSQFKKDVLTEVDQQISSAKLALQNAQTATSTNSSSSTSGTTNTSNTNNGSINNSTSSMTDASGVTWVSDLQNNNEVPPKNNGTSHSAAALLNPGLANSGNTDIKDENLIAPTDANLNVPYLAHPKPAAEPYYTIPVNSTLTGAIAMQPLIGRIPIDGKVPDPYSFKALIGPKNLAANGVDIPPDVQGIVVSGVAEGDMLGKCTRGDVTALTFVFQDGRISTTQAKSGESLGTIAAANGNPCIAGSFHSDALLFLSATAGLAGFQGYGNALSQAQLSTSTSSTTGASISSLIGSANKYAAGQGFSAASQAAQKWWDERVQNSFDFVYVPNVDPKTNKKLELNINITQEISINYDPHNRKVFYDHNNQTNSTNALD